MKDDEILKDLDNRVSVLESKMNGIIKYSEAILPVGFPADKIACQFCPLLRRDKESGAARCWKTGEFLFNINGTIGLECPLIFNNKEEEK